MADYQAIYKDTPPPRWSGYLTHINDLLAFALTEQGWTRLQKKPLLDGYTLMAHFKLAPGRQVGQLLEQLLEAQAAGEIQTADEALQLAAKLLHEKPD